jgi:hypothetical protein
MHFRFMLSISGFYVVSVRVADPYSFFTDLDPDPAS